MFGQNIFQQNEEKGIEMSYEEVLENIKKRDKNDMEKELDVLINPPKRKEMKVNGVKKSKSADFCTNLSVVSFSVNDLLLLRGVPDDRRSWLDMAISQIYPAYPDRVSKAISTQIHLFWRFLTASWL